MTRGRSAPQPRKSWCKTSPRAVTSRADAFSARHQALCAEIDARAIDALLITQLPNLAYLTGLRSSAGAALVSTSAVRLVIDSRYLTVARALTESDGGLGCLEVVPVEQSYDEEIYQELVRVGVDRVGIESAHLTVQRWDWLVRRLEGAGVTLVPVEGLVEAGRLLKDRIEIERFRTAGELLAGAVEPVLGAVRAGRTEREIAADIELQLASAGFDDRAFPTIVASGPNSALPHAQPSRRCLERSDLVLVDFGGVYDGYHVDLSRTVCVGVATERTRRLHDAVLAAQTAAIEAVRPGIPASDIDSVARATLARYGLAEAFGHSTGHGLGLEIHEAPRIGRPGEPGADVVVQEGMVFTVEPAVYVPGVGGVRIEDDVVVTHDGCDVLTGAAPRDLRTVSDSVG